MSFTPQISDSTHKRNSSVTKASATFWNRPLTLAARMDYPMCTCYIATIQHTLIWGYDQFKKWFRIKEQKIQWVLTNLYSQTYNKINKSLSNLVGYRSINNISQGFKIMWLEIDFN